jgi:cytochrome c55X
MCCALLLAVAAPAQSGDEASGNVSRRCTDARIANAWRVLRVVDCARCHGKDYAGLAAPSIVAYAATQGRESFTRMVIDGDPVRGMPGYRENADVAESVEGIYRYFLARANGEIGPDYRPPASSEAIKSACLADSADAKPTGK